MAAKKKIQKKATSVKGKKGRAARSTSGEFPDRIYAIASPRSVGGVSMFEAGERHRREHRRRTSSSDPDVTQRAAHRLQDAGFEVLQVTDAA